MVTAYEAAPFPAASTAVTRTMLFPEGRPVRVSGTLGIMLFATVHGLIDADASGRLRARTGWSDISAGMDFVLDLIAHANIPDS